MSSEGGFRNSIRRSRPFNESPTLSDQLFTRLQIQGSIIWWLAFVAMFASEPLRHALGFQTSKITVWLLVAVPLSLVLGLLSFHLVRRLGLLPRISGSRYFVSSLVSYGTTFFAYSTSIFIVLDTAEKGNSLDLERFVFLLLLASTSACAIVPIASAAHNMALRVEADDRRAKESLEYTQSALSSTYSHFHGTTQGKLLVIANLISEIKEPSSLNHRDEALSILDSLLDDDLRGGIDRLRNVRNLSKLRQNISECAISLHISPGEIAFDGAWSDVPITNPILESILDEAAVVAEELIVNAFKHGIASSIRVRCLIESKFQPLSSTDDSLTLAIEVVNERKWTNLANSKHHRAHTGLKNVRGILEARGGTLQVMNVGGVWTCRAMWKL